MSALSALHAAAPAPAPAPPIVELSGLKVRIGPRFGLDIDSLAIGPGAGVAVIGQNGSGKSVLLETLAGLHRYEGEARVLDADLRVLGATPALRRRLGAQLQRNAYPASIMVSDLIGFHGALYARSDPAVADALGVPALARNAYGDLSRGERQRVDLFMALAHRPPLILLDEPASGLDQAHGEQLLALLEQRGEATLLVASHVAMEIALAERVVWMRDGKVAFHGSRAEAVLSTVGRHRAELVFAGPDAARNCADALRADPRVVRVVATDRGAVRAFGAGPLDDVVRPFVPSADAYGFGVATMDDFLQVVGQPEC